ncbi:MULTISPECIES: TetR family transcriptional regulator [unclassified Streptomyces]|uniref:TetR/AcrR family transcriptional regulator n=1 Tax=unclassified Streptomyces TaxID=2593676 RepID=UPI002DDB2A69|nr:MULTISPECIES: TetR family transcriptional regulator [unclassified Streptomyces]WSB77537.1 TetR family transcriptional regulator [Streptomyces sp. NBC_01775]WSS14197.1 TetR family transcriptional regulator [Streptomyces sp. NBC_01186]WSS43018.1 TetR family transcriptional regulator [Streptomyces sp. NBC_01187]
MSQDEPGTREPAAQEPVRSESAAGPDPREPAAQGTRRRGRPARQSEAEGPGARERILASARGEFAERGYDKVSVRAIARGAGVDAALVHHYFGTKEQVFAAAIEAAFAPAVAVPDALDAAGSREELGERVVGVFFRIWEDPATRDPMLAIVRSAVNNEHAAAVFRRLLTRDLLSRVAGRLESPDAELRVTLAAAQMVGAMLLRYVIRIEPVASEPVAELVARLAPVVQHHLTGPRPYDGI